MKYSVFYGHIIIFKKSIQIQSLYSCECYLFMSKYKYLNKTETILIQMKCFVISAVEIMIRIMNRYDIINNLFLNRLILCVHINYK